MFSLSRVSFSPTPSLQGRLIHPWLIIHSALYLRILAFVPLFLWFVGSGCATPALLPPVDLSTPGWEIQQGQAVWQRGRGQPELAGEVLLAIHSSRATFVQFTKTPFPLVTAQVASDHWQIEFGAGERTFSGRGEPPARFLWLHLASCLDGRSPSARAVLCERIPPDRWRLHNRSSGESLQGYLRRIE